MSAKPKALEDLRDKAMELGASKTSVIKASEVFVKDWVRLKCQFGCGGYGQCLTCPPYSPTPEKMKQVLRDYISAILVNFRPEWEDTHDAMAKLERNAFLSGYYSAFGLAAGPCPFCRKCNLKQCVHPDLARPSMEACGIDVYATARRAGFEIEVVRTRKETPKYFGLLLLE